MRSIEIENYKKNLVLTKRQKQILIGTLLGDTHLESPYRSDAARFKIEHSYKQKDYVDWLYQEFKGWARMLPRERQRQIWGKVYRKYYFSSLAHPKLAVFRKIFYRDGKKIVPKEFLESNLEALGLAVWFMDDGSIKSKQCNGRFLNTQAFTESEVNDLQKILENKFSLKSSTRRDKNRLQIYILGRCSKRLCELIGKYVIPSMRYKLPKLGLTDLPKR